MKPVNIYILTRVSSSRDLARLERQMSGRSRFLKIKEWETEGLRRFSEKLEEHMVDAWDIEFFYSFTMPKLGKEFDLLRVDGESVVNVELKSGNVTDEAIRKQLVQNRYYLATLGKSMYSYCYVSEEDRIMRLSNSGNLVDSTWDELATVLARQKDCYSGNIEELFKEDKYLISPLTDPGRFLRGEYFLTFQQKDIKRSILKNLESEPRAVQGFTGLPGTGKTILLYDIAMQLSKREQVCVLHFGSHATELEELDERLKRIDYHYCETGGKISVTGDYAAILVDEGHRIDGEALKDIQDLAERWNAPVIFSYDSEESVAPEERSGYGAPLIEAIPGFVKYKLTNRIRLNTELSAFIRAVMRAGDNHRRDYPSVMVAYAKDASEARKIIANYQKEGFIYIYDRAVDPLKLGDADPKPAGAVEAGAATCKEFDRVLMLLDDSFEYTHDGYLRHRSAGDDRQDFRVKNLFHGLNRAKEKITLVIMGSERVFDVILSSLYSSSGTSYHESEEK